MNFHSQMALSLWNATGNVLTYFHQMSVLKETYVATEEGLKKFDEKFGIQEELATHICKHMFSNHIARITLEFPHPDVMEIVKDEKVTFADMVGTIGKFLSVFVSKVYFLEVHEYINSWLNFSGGNIGLFCGLSVLSILEVLYWIYKTLIQFIHNSIANKLDEN